MPRFTTEEKIQAVKRYVNGTEGHKTIAKDIGVSHGVFSNWIQQYQHHGERALEKRYTTYTVEDKLEVLQYMIENGTSVRETAAIFNLLSLIRLFYRNRQIYWELQVVYMVDTLIRDISREDIIRLTVFLGIIIIGNWLIKRYAKNSASKSSKFFQRFLPIIDSLADWITFYGIIILLLLTFSKKKWLFNPLYTHGEVDVTILLIVIAFLIVSLAHRLIKLFNKYILSSVYDYYGVDKGLGYTFNQIIYYTVMFAALAVSLTSVGINLTAIGAVFGVLGIGIGFGMRNVAGNFVSGIIILFERPIEVGEIIQINDKVGRVEKIRLRSTIIRTAKEGTLIVPNQYFIEQIVKNRTSARMMAQVKVSVAFGTDTHLVQALLEQAVNEIKENEQGILDSPEPDIRFIDFQSKAMEFQIEIPVVNFEIKEKIESKIRHMVAAIFIEKNIQLPAVTFQMSDKNILPTSERTE